MAQQEATRKVCWNLVVYSYRLALNFVCWRLLRTVARLRKAVEELQLDSLAAKQELAAAKARQQQLEQESAAAKVRQQQLEQESAAAKVRQQQLERRIAISSLLSQTHAQCYNTAADFISIVSLNVLLPPVEGETERLKACWSAFVARLGDARDYAKISEAFDVVLNDLHAATSAAPAKEAKAVKPAKAAKVAKRGNSDKDGSRLSEVPHQKLCYAACEVISSDVGDLCVLQRKSMPTRTTVQQPDIFAVAHGAPLLWHNVMLSLEVERCIDDKQPGNHFKEGFGQAISYFTEALAHQPERTIAFGGALDAFTVVLFRGIYDAQSASMRFLQSPPLPLLPSARAQLDRNAPPLGFTGLFRLLSSSPPTLGCNVKTINVGERSFQTLGVLGAGSSSVVYALDNNRFLKVRSTIAVCVSCDPADSDLLLAVRLG